MTPADFAADGVAWVRAIGTVLVEITVQLMPIIGGVMGIVAYYRSHTLKKSHEDNAAAIQENTKEIEAIKSGVTS